MIENMEISPENKMRKSNFELLRIVSMMMIVFSHYCVHNHVDVNMETFCFDKIWLHLGTMGNLGVNIFFVLSGFFLSEKREPFKKEKAAFLEREVWFYSLSIYLILAALNLIPFQMRDFVKSLFPTITWQYSFFTVYLVLYFLSPYLNKMIHALDQKNFRRLLIITVIFFSVLPIIIPISDLSSYGTDAVLCYLIGAYLNHYGRTDRSIPWIFGGGGILVLWFTGGLLNILFKNILGNEWILYDRRSPIVLFCAAMIVLLFSQIRLENKWINIISQHVFAVFLISDNNYLRNVLWGWLSNEGFSLGQLAVHSILCTLVVFNTCIFLDMVRTTASEKIKRKRQKRRGKKFE